MNEQTPGPLICIRCAPALDSTALALAIIPGGKHHGTVAIISNARSVTTAPTADQAQANRRLLAASYTAFDKAGRELGIDAAELAERVDLVDLFNRAGLPQWILVRREQEETKRRANVCKPTP